MSDNQYTALRRTVDDLRAQVRACEVDLTMREHDIALLREERNQHAEKLMQATALLKLMASVCDENGYTFVAGGIKYVLATIGNVREGE
jgi:hypothetical protein